MGSQQAHNHVCPFPIRHHVPCFPGPPDESPVSQGWVGLCHGTVGQTVAGKWHISWGNMNISQTHLKGQEQPR